MVRCAHPSSGHDLGAPDGKKVEINRLGNLTFVHGEPQKYSRVADSTTTKHHQVGRNELKLREGQQGDEIWLMGWIFASQGGQDRQSLKSKIRKVE